MDRRDINYLRSTIESYDGMALVSTLDPNKACVALHISPGCEQLVSELLACLREEGLDIVEKEVTKACPGSI